MNPRSPVFRRCIHVLVLLAGCKESPSKVTPPPPGPVTVTDKLGAPIAEVRPGHPCRGRIGAEELIVGGPPLIATLGATTWKGSDEANGTVLLRDDERVARIYPVGKPDETAVFDMHGIAQIRVAVAKGVATVQDRASVPVRTLSADKGAKGAIVTSDGSYMINGTDDLVLAALLSAPEVDPDVRMLAACQRVLLKGTK
jgi:hypothetical protein